MRSSLLAVPLGTALLVAQPVSAQDFPDKFAINIGEDYLFDTDTDFSARSSSGLIGTSINFERDLGGDERLGTPRIDGYYRFNPNHRLDFSWIRIDRDGSELLSRDISFLDNTFTVATRLDSEVDASFTKLAYTWSFYHSEEVELGLTAGAVLTDYDIRISAQNEQVNESVKAPLPILGLRLDYQISPRWHVKLKNDSVYIDLGDQLKGSFETNSLALEWRVARNVALGLGSERMALDATVDDGDFRGRLANFYRSARLYVGIRF